jgi:hypothetical protein
MNRSTASQGSRADARNPSAVRWPRVGATITPGAIVVRELDEGERPATPRAVVVAEPCEQFPCLADAMAQAAKHLTARLRKSVAPGVEIVNALAV